MTIEHVLAVVSVRDIDAADSWYEQLFGGPADNRPMEGLIEWQVTDTAWVQVTVDAERAGSSVFNLAVDDLDRHVEELSARGLRPGEIETMTKGVQLAALRDPDQNLITLIGNFRVSY